ncbi:MAG TPA: hypothetical protein VG733_05205 [Chthoniobacteraceae bacterium]|nr:hypothetical protein [Chthoniobacteraceae bacterium]
MSDSPRVLIEISKETHTLVKTRAFELGKTLRQYVGSDIEPVIIRHVKKAARPTKEQKAA